MRKRWISTRVYKEKQYLVFDYEDGRTVKYDFATKTAIGIKGKPVKDLRSQLSGMTIRGLIDCCDDEKYAKEFENLAELKSGDTAQFSFNASHSIVGNGKDSGDGATYVISGSLTAVMDTNGNWSLKK